MPLSMMSTNIIISYYNCNDILYDGKGLTDATNTHLLDFSCLATIEVCIMYDPILKGTVIIPGDL